MLDSNTKRRIDSARDILVGKVPDPKSQVEQITIALIYKFMDDMDAQAEEFGGKRTFFAGEFAKYGWAKLMHAGLGGHETLNLYGEGITKMTENPGIPPLFRNIFKNAYLPYRDPETLRAFLKIIDEFSYDHSERLGDAFEYLLSVLGSQGDAGQFRTPRHIIDFMVEIVDPQKNEIVLDPACGTAGFLISSYKHILQANTDKHGASTLTPDEKGRLATNFIGYDISPDMVRLSLVNLYLHGFPDPHIHEYDTLTSEDKWNETADVILANPPFMSPKGGIRPHQRFGVQSKRSEVLFVDYMAEHLTANGRAAIIVPEGIIFQSQNAYKQLRKMLVDEALVAVVSLPSGIFQPYSGVKTSILILDKTLARQTDSVAFFKIENDGFGLGAQRRAIEKNDLPQVKNEIAKYLQRVRAGESLDDFQPALGLIVEKEKIAANGDYNLSGERYRVGAEKLTTFPRVRLADVCAFISDGDWIESKDQSPTGIRLIQTGNVGDGEYLDKTDKARYISEETFARLQCTEIFEGDILVSRLPDPVGRACILPALRGRAITAVDCSIIRFDPQRFIANLFPYYTQSAAYYRELDAFLTGASRSRISRKNLEEIQIPLPPLEVQQEIVAEIEGYQKVINGARAVLDNYRPQIPIDPAWPMVELGEAAEFISGYAFKGADMTEAPAGDNCRRVVKIGNVGRDGRLDISDARFHAYTDEFARFVLRVGDIVMAMTGATVGKVAVVKDDGFLLNQRVGMLRAKPGALQNYILHLLCSAAFYDFCQRTAGGGAQGNIAPREILEYEIPLPPLATQQAIVSEIEAEQSLVAANRELIARFEAKIQSTLARIWGDESAEEV
jgi:type I restriction enzyme M protein